MASNNIARLGVVLGLDTAEFTASIDKAINENRKLGQAIKRESNAAAGEIVSLKNATDDYGKTLTKVQIIEREISTGRFRLASNDLKMQLLAQAAAYDQVATSAHKAAGGLTAWQKQGLAYQTTDFFTQIASGQSIIIAAIQQGGQLKDQMGGLGNMFRVLTPLVISPTGALVAFVATLGLAATAAVMGRKEFDALNNSLILTGQYSGVTTDSFALMAKTISTTSRASVGDAKDILNALIGSGQFTNQTFDSVSKTIQRFSELSGLAAKDAATKLIPMLDGSASSAKKLNDQYNFLTLAQYKQIEALARQNKIQESIILTSDLMRASFDKTKTELGYLDEALDFTKKKWSEFWDAAMNWGKPDSVPDQIRTIQERINAMAEKGLPKQRLLLGDKDENVKAYIDELNSLEEQKAKLIAILVKANDEAKKIEGEKKKIDIYAKDGGYQHELSLQERYQDAVDALGFEGRKAAADEQEKLQIESYERQRALLVSMQRDIAGKDKNYAKLRRDIYFKELDVENKQYEQKYEAFLQKRLNLEIDAAEAERDARKKIDDQEAEDKLQRLMNDVEYYQKDTESSAKDAEKLQRQIEMVGWNERQVKLTELEAKYKEDIANNEKQYGGDQATLEALNAMAEAKKRNGELNINLANQLKDLKEVNDSVWANMTSAIDEFVQKGETSFNKLVESILKDLLKIQLRKQALALWDMATGGKGLMGLFSAPATMSMNVGSFADGGVPPVGVPSMVGERGPELFVPRTAGTIVPNHMLSSSQQAPTINYNGPYIASMNAIDTQSGLQFLAKNKQSVWSAYQSANRSIPMSR
jgi:phage-related minor tail protein